MKILRFQPTLKIIPTESFKLKNCFGLNVKLKNRNFDF